MSSNDFFISLAIILANSTGTAFPIILYPSFTDLYITAEENLSKKDSIPLNIESILFEIKSSLPEKSGRENF